jgi:hypothetical protein
VELDEVVLERAAQPMSTELGTLDALHLATAVLWREMARADLVMATHDTALGMAARGWQPWPTVVRIEALAQSFDVSVEAMLLENLIQSRVDEMRGTARQIFGSPPTSRLPSRAGFVCPSPSATV